MTIIFNHTAALTIFCCLGASLLIQAAWDMVTGVEQLFGGAVFWPWPAMIGMFVTDVWLRRGERGEERSLRRAYSPFSGGHVLFIPVWALAGIVAIQHLTR